MNSQSNKDAQANASSEREEAKKDVQILWEEYKYRHELCWKNTFQITLAFVALSVIPYLHKEVVRALGWTVIAAPLLALALVGFAVLVMINELILFGKIKGKYREKQQTAFNIPHENSSEKDSFFWFVLIYLLILLLLCLVNLVYIGRFWVPYVNSLPDKFIYAWHPVHLLALGDSL
jgi:hypothetical protein